MNYTHKYIGFKTFKTISFVDAQGNEGLTNPRFGINEDSFKYKKSTGKIELDFYFVEGDGNFAQMRTFEFDVNSYSLSESGVESIDDFIDYVVSAEISINEDLKDFEVL